MEKNLGRYSDSDIIMTFWPSHTKCTVAWKASFLLKKQPSQNKRTLHQHGGRTVQDFNLIPYYRINAHLNNVYSLCSHIITKLLACHCKNSRYILFFCYCSLMLHFINNIINIPTQFTWPQNRSLLLLLQYCLQQV